MAGNDYKYVIVDSTVITVDQALVDKCAENPSPATCSTTTEGVVPQLCILKYRFAQPTELAGLTEYTEKEIRALIKPDPDWNPPEL